MSEYPRVPAAGLPTLSVEQMREADRLAIEEFGISLLQMMEHAGSALAELTHRLYPDGAVTVLAGGGSNGGGGLCAARHLVNRGRRVEVVRSTNRGNAAVEHHLGTLAAMGIGAGARPATDSPVVVDAMVGYGLEGSLRGRAAELAAWTAGRVVVALDFPSGHPEPGAVDAAATLTLALPKAGLESVGRLFVADLGLPAALWARMGIVGTPVFADSRIVEVIS